MSKHLEIELLRLREENTRLRQKLRENGRHARRIQRAYDAAILLAIWHVALWDTGREFAKSMGMSVRTWENAMTLLRMGRVVNRRSWKVHELATIEKALQKAQDRALETPEVFFAYGTRHMTT